MYTQKRIVAALTALAVLLASCADAPETRTPARHHARPARPGVADVVEAWPLPCWELDEVEPIYPTDPPCASGAPHWRCTDAGFDAGFATLAELGVTDAVCRRVDESPAPWVCCSGEP